MSYTIGVARAVKIKGGKTTEVAVNYRQFLLQNTGETAVYFKEYNIDEEKATAANGFVLWSGETAPVVMTAKTLSIFASAEAEVRMLYVDEG